MKGNILRLSLVAILSGAQSGAVRAASSEPVTLADLAISTPVFSEPLAFAEDYQKGVSYIKFGSRFDADAEGSFAELLKSGTEWVSFVPVYYQDKKESLVIYPYPDKSPSDDNLKAAIKKAQSYGFKIMLKPHVDVADGSWRGEIRVGSDARVKRWFASYLKFILHFARIAEELKVDEFCIGAELEKMAFYTEEWKKVIKEVRKVYHGPLLYDGNHDGVNNVGFWADLDYIGISAYYSIADSSAATPQEMRLKLDKSLDRLEKLSNKYGRKIIFAEAGYSDLAGTAITPWAWVPSKTVSYREQALCYQISLELYSKRGAWLKGVFWWNWELDPSSHFTPYRKPAEEVLTEAWKKAVLR